MPSTVVSSGKSPVRRTNWDVDGEGVNAAGDDMALLRSAAMRPGGLLEVLSANKAHRADESAAPSVSDSSTLFEFVE